MSANDEQSVAEDSSILGSVKQRLSNGANLESLQLRLGNLPLVPLGAGDLIDRAVRLYRRHFFTLIGIAAPPVLVSAVGSVLWGIGWRETFVTTSSAWLAIYLLIVSAGWAIMVTGVILTFVVMGGATRNLVTHLLYNEPFSFRTTYRNVRARFWHLLGAAIVVAICVSFAAFVALFAWYMLFLFAMVAVIGIAGVSGWLAAAFGIAGFLVSLIIALWLFFFLAGRFAYVPQAMMVEGKGVFAAVSRSTSLARGNVKRLAGVTLFTGFAAYSALMILIVPLGWYGYLNGINPSPFDAQNWPMWYSIGYGVLWQSSSILLTPVWMLGLSLLYLDERVRHEGYDIELMAAQKLGPMPKLPDGRDAPFSPALAGQMKQGRRVALESPTSFSLSSLNAP